MFEELSKESPSLCSTMEKCAVEAVAGICQVGLQQTHLSAQSDMWRLQQEAQREEFTALNMGRI